jgi:hypothetical protein
MYNSSELFVDLDVWEVKDKYLMKLDDDLIEKLGYKGATNLKIKENCKALAGIEVEIIGAIKNIYPELNPRITYGKHTRTNDQEKARTKEDNRNGTILLSHEHMGNFEGLYIVYLLYYDKNKFEKQLIPFSGSEEWGGGDGVKIKAKIKRATGLYPTLIEFDLLSIIKIDTREERINTFNKEKEEEHAKHKGCFIATACYRSYNAPEVLILRQYRDEVLLKSGLGRIAVNIYYCLSPPVANILAKSDTLRYFVRKYLLNPFLKVKVTRWTKKQV